MTSAKEEAPSVPTHLPGDLVFLMKVPTPQDPVTLLMISRDRAENLPNSQRSPKKPGGHWQRVVLAPRHLPPFRHSQSLGIPAWGQERSFHGQKPPSVNPGQSYDPRPPQKNKTTEHTHTFFFPRRVSFVYNPREDVAISSPPPSLAPALGHSPGSPNILSVQFKPMKPSGHSHTYPGSASTQVPPFWQGLERQGEGTG